MATAKNELKAQRIATEYAYRKRIHEFEMQEKELVWQRERVRFLLLYISNFILKISLLFFQYSFLILQFKIKFFRNSYF